MDKTPTRGALLLARDILTDLRDCGRPSVSDDFVHRGLTLSHQLAGVVRFSLRQDPRVIADAVHCHRWQCALLDCLSSPPPARGPALDALVLIAAQGRAPREQTL